MLSKNSSYLTALFIIVVATVVNSPTFGAGKRQPRVANEVVAIAYDAFQAGQPVGTIAFDRTTYSDNTIEYTGTINITPIEKMVLVTEFEYEVQEESLFPRRYFAKKTVDNQMAPEAKPFESTTLIEMFTNVAVVNSEVSGGKSRTVHRLPTGTAFIEREMVFQLEQLAFWYNEDLGGRQEFDLFDPSNMQQERVLFVNLGKKTIETLSGDQDATHYSLEREKYALDVYIDERGRIVRVVQFQSVFDLVKWEPQTGDE